MTLSPIPEAGYDLVLRQCSSCNQEKPLDDFPIKTHGPGRGVERVKTCLPCGARISMAKKKKKAAEEVPPVAIFDFVVWLSQQSGHVSFEASVDCTQLESIPGRRERADKIAGFVWEVTDYRYTYHTMYQQKDKKTTRFAYGCAQSQQRQQNPRKKENTKSRGKRAMPSFACDGWLYITVTDSSGVVQIKLTHALSHPPYIETEVPSEIVEYVETNRELPLVKIWSGVRAIYRAKINSRPPFSRKVVYNLWSKMESKKWKRDEDEVASAKKLLEEWRGTADCRAELVELKQEEGLIALAFVLPDLLDKWAARIREVSMDSAWNTNGSRFEVYAVMGEAYGSGLPIAYIAIQSNSHTPGAKEKLLRQLLLSLRDRWGIRAKITLTDKDFGEINAMRGVWPEAKHQLCFWHALRAVKKRMAILRRMPGPYNEDAAHREFPWISTDFLPIAQGGTSVPLEHPLPHIRIRLDGQLQPSAIPEQPRLTIKIPARSEAISTTETVLDEQDGELDVLEEGGDQQGRDDHQTWQKDVTGDLEERLEAEIEDDETDTEDVQDYDVESDEKTSKDPKYVFCPSPHRKQLLRLFTKHFCQHPLLPEQDGHRTSEEIRTAAVWEMYQFCYQRGLAEVWAYMWTQWYAPARWVLWARSTSSTLISRLRTTMNVENFWRQLKHDFLHHHLRPRLDELVYVLIANVTPAYLERAEILDDDRRFSRAQPLTTYQKYFKKSWTHLKSIPCSSRNYGTNVMAWTCNCGAQKYNAHLLCKHLVQAVPEPSHQFFAEIHRRRTLPIYRHHELRPIVELTSTTAPPQTGSQSVTDGSITDGDDDGRVRGPGEAVKRRREGKLLAEFGIDIAASGPTSMLHDAIRLKLPARDASDLSQVPQSATVHSIAEPLATCRPRALFASTENVAPLVAGSTTLPLSPPPHDLAPPLTPTHTRKRPSTPPAPLSPSPRTLAQYGPRANEASPQSPSPQKISGPSSAVLIHPRLPIQDPTRSEQYQEELAHMKRMRDAFRQGAEILDAQLPYPEPVFLGNFKRGRIGCDVEMFVRDATRALSTSRTQDTTWALNGDRQARRRRDNTMGLQPRTRKLPDGRQVQSSP